MLTQVVPVWTMPGCTSIGWADRGRGGADGRNWAGQAVCMCGGEECWALYTGQQFEGDQASKRTNLMLVARVLGLTRNPILALIA